MIVSCISHRVASRVLVINSDFLFICDKDECQAILLRYFEHRTNSIIEEAKSYSQMGMNNKVNISFYASPKFLKKETLNIFSENTIRKALASLVEKDFIQIFQETFGNQNVPAKVILNVAKINSSIANINSLDFEKFDNFSTSNLKGGDFKFEGGGTSNLKGVNDLIHISSSNTDITDKNAQKSADLKTVNLDEKFIEWWNIYPKKVEKKQALRDFKNLFKKQFNQEIYGKIISHTIEYAQKLSNVAYCIKPHYYIQDESWNNESFFQIKIRDKVVKKEVIFNDNLEQNF